MPADNARPFNKIVGYVRVSTKMQGLSGLGLEAQRAAIEAYARQVGVPVAAWFEEVESGTRSDRPQLAAAIRQCALTGAALVAAKIDRFGRKASDLFALRDARFPVIAVDTPNADGFLFGVLALVAEKERDSISERTKAALAAAKARGRALGGWRGGPKITYEAGLKARQDRAHAFAASVGPIARELRDSGLSLRQVAAALAERGVRTSQDGAWTAAAVRNLLNRAP
jgi:DNA invertase Pin-like site-specific DNA recombinase